MSRFSSIVLTVIISAQLVGEASAHFLFIRVGEQGEGGRRADVFFSERAEAGDPRFVGKISHTKLWMQSEPGTFTPLTIREGSDRLRASIPSTGAISVIGECEYGVLKRDVAFLLQYYPKTIAGTPAELNEMKPREAISFEIMANIDGDEVRLTALANGKPVPNVVFTTIDDDLANEELTSDANGVAVWKPTSRGHFCVYAKHVIAKEGTRQISKEETENYTEIRQFATLAFRWPLVREGADKEAVEMFERAIAARAAWKDFPGFTSQIEGVVNGRSFSGDVKVDENGDLSLSIDEPTAEEWVDDQLSSIVLHRRATDGTRGSPVLRFADDDTDHPLGRLVTFVGGSFASSYRVKDDQLTVVNRSIGPSSFTITVLENEQNAEGKILPKAYVVQYWDSKTGRLIRSESFRNDWMRVGNFDLPTGLTMTTASDAGLTTRSFRLTKHQLRSKN